eukprot:359619-Chlamydomonas_euryale.AAC.5
MRCALLRAVEAAVALPCVAVLCSAPARSTVVLCGAGGLSAALSSECPVALRRRHAECRRRCAFTAAADACADADAVHGIAWGSAWWLLRAGVDSLMPGRAPGQLTGASRAAKGRPTDTVAAHERAQSRAVPSSTAQVVGAGVAASKVADTAASMPPTGCEVWLSSRMAQSAPS